MNSGKILFSLTAATALMCSFIAPSFVGAQGNDSPAKGHFQFEPLPTSVPCTAGGNPVLPFVLPAGYAQAIFVREGEGGTTDNFDMNTLNETGVHAGRYLYRTHETGSNGAVTVTDLETGVTSVVVQRQDWEALDGIVWTPRGTILFAEERVTTTFKDPEFSQAQAGLVYELYLDPNDLTRPDTTVNPNGVTPGVVVMPAIGSRSHEGLRFDPQGNLYGISESSPPSGGYIYRFTPDRKGDYSSGQLYALKVTSTTGDRTGEAIWVPLDRASVQISSDLQATSAGATGYGRPEDVELATSTGNNRGGANILYVALTSEDRVLAIDLREPRGGRNHTTAFVTDYVRAGVNAPPGGAGPNNFDAPDNLALDKNGNLYIGEDPGGSFPAKQFGDDVWVAIPDKGNTGIARETVRFASLTDCNAEPTGPYFDLSGRILFINVQHRGGDGRDYAVSITRED